jgi:hypothetical protein
MIIRCYFTIDAATTVWNQLHIRDCSLELQFPWGDDASRLCTVIKHSAFCFSTFVNNFFIAIHA